MTKTIPKREDEVTASGARTSRPNLVTDAAQRSACDQYVQVGVEAEPKHASVLALFMPRLSVFRFLERLRSDSRWPGSCTNSDS